VVLAVRSTFPSRASRTAVMSGSTAPSVMPTSIGSRMTGMAPIGLSSSAILFIPCFFYGGGFSFSIFRIHPPNIFPMSFRSSERSMYFLLSNIFSSHVTCRKNFNESSLMLAFRKNGSLFPFFEITCGKEMLERIKKKIVYFVFERKP
jgi:hypothetical protein